MFTGLIEEVGVVKSVKKGADSAQITISAEKVISDVNLGDSVCTNGICLTVTSFSSNYFTVDVMAETMRKTNLNYLSPGDKVNLERALRLGDRLGGHIVSGHIDGIGTISNLEKEDNATWITVSSSYDILKYVIYKGSIAIDGVSLTVAYVDDSVFKVSIIPHTKDVTILLDKKIGDTVNLECDMIGKYVEKMLSPKPVNNESKSNISMNFLEQNGFI